MSEEMPKAGVYFIVEWNWPREFTNEQGQLARKIHTLTNELDWIKEVVAASSGVGGDRSSIWIFYMDNYGGIDRLYSRDEDLGKAYTDFMRDMNDVTEKVRGEVIFM